MFRNLETNFVEFVSSLKSLGGGAASGLTHRVMIEYLLYKEYSAGIPYNILIDAFMKI